MGRKLVDSGWRSRQKILSTVVTSQQGEEFNRITKDLGLTHSEAIRQLVIGVINGTYKLKPTAKPFQKPYPLTSEE